MEKAKGLENEADLAGSALLLVFKHFRAYLLSAGNEHDSFHLQMTLHESPQSVQLPFKPNDGVKLFEIAGHDPFLPWLVAVDIQRIM